ncbi:MAG: ATP-binding protein [Myxococcota bacterium]
MFSRLLSIGECPNETANARVNRQTLVLGGVLMSGGGLMWGVLALAVGQVAASSIPLGYGVITAINLSFLSCRRKFSSSANVQILISLLLPFLFQWSLGGFVSSGGVMLWAILALVGSLTLSSARQAIIWLVLYCTLTVITGLLDEELARRSTLVLSPALHRSFVVINITTISAIVFTLGWALTQRQQRAIRALEAGTEANRALAAQLQENVSSRELDIERLRAAESALTALASGLESQVKARTAELEGALVRAEAGTRAKGEFLAMMSHEIRTPLNGILGTVDLLQHSQLDEEQQSSLGLIRRSGDLLLSIINDVLDFSKIEAGRLELVARPFHLRAELEGVVGLHRSAAAERGVSVTLELSPDMPEMLVLDVDRLLQVTGNLLGNAVKFTHQGTIRVSAALLEEGGEPRLSMSVTDTGIGIAEEQLSRLFQPFSQADSSTTRRYGGTGLGLVICARLVEMMGGHISVQSQPGQGTTFRFDVKAAIGAKPEAARRGESLTPRSEQNLGLRVLLAEDNPVNQAIGMRLLRSLGCEASLATDGQVAVSMVSAGAYDVVLMDMQMPNVDGITSARTIRGLHLEHQPRIVALTANAYASDRQACLDAGMDDFMAKPLRLEQLREQLRRVPALSQG